jgi:hypothetical protein
MNHLDHVMGKIFNYQCSHDKDCTICNDERSQTGQDIKQKLPLKEQEVILSSNISRYSISATSGTSKKKQEALLKTFLDIHMNCSINRILNNFDDHVPITKQNLFGEIDTLSTVVRFQSHLFVFLDLIDGKFADGEKFYTKNFVEQFQNFSYGNNIWVVTPFQLELFVNYRFDEETKTVKIKKIDKQEHEIVSNLTIISPSTSNSESFISDFIKVMETSRYRISLFNLIKALPCIVSCSRIVETRKIFFGF